MFVKFKAVYCRVSDPFTEIPADMLLFQICIPFAIEHFKLRTTIKSLLRYWFTAVGWALGLTEFLLPRPDDNGGQENGNIDIRHDRNIEIRQGGIQVIPLGPDRALVGMPMVDDLNRGTVASQNSDVSEDYDGDVQSDSE